MQMQTRRIAAATSLALFLAACSGYQTRAYESGKGLAPTSIEHVEVLYSNPARPFEVIGAVSAKKYKPGWTDPSVMDAEAQLKAAGAQLGADAVVVRGSRDSGTRIVYVDAEAIRYTVK